MPQTPTSARNNRIIGQSVPSPYGGWNTRDALGAMSQTDAVVLDNWFPTVGDVVTRKGYTEHVTGLGNGAVETVAEYHSGADRHLIASCDGELFDATTSASSLGSGYSNDRWQTVNFNGLLVMVNGQDTPVSYDGSSVSNMSWSGLTSSTLIGVAVSHNRLFFWADNSQSFWYASVNAISGPLDEFNLSRVARFGGKIVSIFNWTVDTGEGMDDKTVILFSSGQAAIYSGTDPGDSTNWSLQGVYDIGEPAAHRGMVQIGSDVRIITSTDYISFPELLARGLGKPTKASGALQKAYSAQSESFGWHAVFFPEGPFALFNVPTSSGYVQHVLNTTTNAWCRFTDIKAHAWTTFDGGIYYGGDSGVIYKFWDGASDNGSAINAEGLQAWSNFGSDFRKRVTTYRIILTTIGDLDYSSSIGYDFINPSALSPQTISSTGTPWGSPWGSPWSPGSTVTEYWNMAVGSGVSVAPKVKVSASKSVSWLRTDMRAEIGQFF